MFLFVFHAFPPSKVLQMTFLMCCLPDQKPMSYLALCRPISFFIGVDKHFCGGWKIFLNVILGVVFVFRKFFWNFNEFFLKNSSHIKKLIFENIFSVSIPWFIDNNKTYATENFPHFMEFIFYFLSLIKNRLEKIPLFVHVAIGGNLIFLWNNFFFIRCTLSR